MKETKDKFLNNLGNKTIPATESKVLLNKLDENEFIAITSEENQYIQEQAYWNSDYFYKLFAIAKRDFSKEICEHLIEVKYVLQKRGEKGFELTKVQEDLSSDNNQNDTDTDSHISFEQLDKHIDLLKNYVPDIELKNIVAQGDIDAIKNKLLFMLSNQRLATKDILLVILYIQQNIPTFFEAYSVKKFHPAYDENEKSWDDEYFSYQQSYLNHNFSLERLLHLLNVRDFMIENGLSGFNKENIKSTQQTYQYNNPKEQKQRSNQYDNNHNQSTPQDRQNQFIKTIAIVGGAVLAGLLLLLSAFR